MKRLLIPFFVLLLAALACDSPVYDPPHVMGVYADPDSAGRVYARVGNAERSVGYASDDYGVSWSPTDAEFETAYSETLRMSGDDLLDGETLVWSFPRPVYRFFFLSDDDREYFALPYGYVSASEAHGALYVAMGTEGILTFTPPGVTPAGDWHLSAAGISQLNPLPLTITDAPTLGVIIALALLIPPLPLLHAFLLSRVWRYALPMPQAWRLALVTTLIITVLAAFAVVFWLTNPRTDYYPVVAAMTAITVVLGVAASVLALPEGEGWRLGRRAGLVSLVVPLGVASIWWGWLIIIPLVTGYFIYHRSYSRALRLNEHLTPGMVDRLTLVSLGLLAGGGLILGAIFYGLGSLVRDLAMVGVALVLAVVTIRVLTASLEKFAAERELTTNSLRRTISLATIAAYVFAPILAVAVFMGQSYAYNWFTSLLVPR